MANGETFAEIRRIVEDDEEISQKGALRLVLAAVHDIHRDRSKDMADLKGMITEIRGEMQTFRDRAKYPSALWYLVNMPLKTLGVFAAIMLVLALIFVPDVREWARQELFKLFLGAL